jgi:nicotinate-nucleotide adenylyltransferase
MKTGLFFGSFNPIHTGHLAIASYMIEFTDLDRVWFVVSPHNPLKNKETLLDDQLRLEMVKLAVSDDPRFDVCDIEFSLPQPSFTIDTLNHLQQNHPDRVFSIIMGSDGLVTFNQWKKHREITDRFKRYVYPRPETPEIYLKTLENGILVDSPQLEISSTFIREAIAEKRNVRYFVPDIVWKFIISKNLYTNR